MRTVILLGTLLSALTTPVGVCANDGEIALFLNVGGVLDPGACVAQTIFIPGRFGYLEFSVMLKLRGATTGGISSVECYLEGLEKLPESWQVDVLHSPGSVLSGDFVSGRGAPPVRRGILEYPTLDGRCEARYPGLFPLFRVKVWGLGVVDDIANDTRVSVVGATPPSDPRYTCPAVTLCHGSAYTKVCVGGGRVTINPSTISCPTTSAVSDATWSQIKQLFQ